MNTLKSIGQFWYDFIVGDDWKIAVAVVSALGVLLGLLLAGVVSSGLGTVVGAILMFGLFAIGLMIDIRGSRLVDDDGRVEPQGVRTLG